MVGDMASAIYSGFLGTWTLDPDSCDYEQSEPPKEGTYRIEERGDQLHFIMRWVDEKDEEHLLSFSGPPNGQALPFPGGVLADALAIKAVSERELNTSAYFQGEERMIAQRQLDATGYAMRVTQVVRFSDGSSAANIAVYHKNASA